MSDLFSNSKIGVTIGIMGATLAILYVELSPTKGPPLTTYGNKAVLLSIFGFYAPAIGAGGLCGYVIEALIIRKFIMAKELFLYYEAGSIIGCIIAGIIVLPIGLFIGVVVGTTLGGGIGEAISIKLGFENIGTFIGLFFSIIVVTVVMVISASAFGAIAGWIVHYALARIFWES